MHFYKTINNNIHKLKIRFNVNMTVNCKDAAGNQSWELVNRRIKFITLILYPRVG